MVPAVCVYLSSQQGARPTRKEEAFGNSDLTGPPYTLGVGNVAWKSENLFYIRWRLGFLLLVASFVILAGDARGAIELETIASGLSSPLCVTTAGDGNDRLFIVEQGGRIRILSGDALLATPFLEISDRVRSGGERGLLGLAFHPSYPANGRFFVNYTRDGANGLKTVVAEYAVSPENVNLAVKGSEEILLSFRQPFSNHNGGILAFGPEGFLYIGTGDGGSGGDPQGNGQNLETLLGKILRIDVDSGSPFAVPQDNPFVGKPGGDEIWAYGLRNPWRFSFDRVTGRLMAGDVGQNRLEEIDIIVKGGNYGWNIMEGTLCFSPPSNCNTSGLIPPIHEYGRDLGISVTGGYVYRGPSAPSLWGKYLFADFGSGRLWALTEISPGQWQREQVLSTGLSISSFGEDESGELYVVDYYGSVRRIVDPDAPQPAVNEGGVVNGASFASGAAVAPGSIASVFGANLAPATGSPVEAPLTTIFHTTLRLNDIAVPLFLVSPTQINFQIPWQLQGQAQASVLVTAGAATSSPQTIDLAPFTPGLFATNAAGSGQGAILIANTGSVAAPVGMFSGSRPATRGEFVSIFCTGLGPVTNQPPTGVAALSNPLSRTTTTPTVTIGGVAATVSFSGLAPAFVGLYQVDVQVPANAPTGDSAPVVLSIGGVTSNRVTIAVE